MINAILVGACGLYILFIFGIMMEQLDSLRNRVNDLELDNQKLKKQIRSKNAKSNKKTVK